MAESSSLPEHLHDRLAEEARFHDEQAAQRAATFAKEPHRLAFSDAEYLDHEPWIRPAMQQLLGHFPDRTRCTLLDYGCGHGMAAVVMARAGARVWGCDLSAGYIREAEQRAIANGVPEIEWTATDVHRLPYADASVDGIWGSAILHHLDLSVAATELRRILKPGGVAVFCEPWGGNPLLRLARRRLPYPGKHRTADEAPLMPADLPKLRAIFPKLSVQGYQLFGMLRRLRLPGGIARGLDRIDRGLLKIAPKCGHWGRYIVVTLVRD
ncbi:class I SAM-dependent methyltransferase [Tuwongella immobilis]|uniref:Methyltransferase type 11 domain-containing protein n=1 Tax=Tuwongella immobilis TaxID=692036 RepID=A0A6C2YLI7_9BACT|nr:class I SAM-dependent methyltransferase [Tuwongella immobilis]VIP01965.1 methyltransferase type 11 : Methyltransferase type 11 OS=Rhizobium tropici CIAT 899 GN=RTCIAT899_CH09090 PE=4 SV=1: Methyltransf_11 [Tuwongella immobilis]VTR99982.1 methyltransferase type 11 : Methyltransferase type 11 OS=Rhizobium tropici CIAT 899 GN=RTCIAT899_CH09090 PE=4 SV=1: Methyltransf_11 [Tuwongella immobilis]